MARLRTVPLLLAFASPLTVPLAAQAPNATQFVQDFGADGERGSFRVEFDELGAGVVFVQTKDHYVDVAARDKPQHAPEDYMLLVYCGSDYSLRVAGPQDGKLFPQSPWSGRWQHEVVDGAVRFWIDGEQGLRLYKTFRHRPEQRGLSVELRLERRGDAAGGDLPTSLPLELVGTCLFNRNDVALFVNPTVGIAQAVGGAAKHVGPDSKGNQQELLQLDGHELAMAGSTNRFFGGFLFPLDDGARTAVTRVDIETLPKSELPPIADGDPPTKAHSMPRPVLALNLPMPAAGAATTATFGVYLGPKSFTVFAETEEHARFLPIMDVDLEPPCCGVSVPGGRFMATTLVKLLGIFHGVVGQWGIAIMLLTILVRGCLAPLNFRMQKSMREYGKRMAVVKPKLDELKRRYADDPKAHQQAMLQFQREHKLMPPLGGCLPIFLTMPIYVGLFTALRTAYDLRQQSFLFMHDLSRPDSLFELPFSLPLFGHLFNIMPILWISLMVVLQLRMPLPTDPQQRQTQQIMRFMPLIFGVALYNYASGLMVYMVTSMLWTFVESAITKRILGPIDPNAAGMAPTPMM